MTLEELSSACAKLEPANSKNKEILEINALQNFAMHALFISFQSRMFIILRTLKHAISRF